MHKAVNVQHEYKFMNLVVYILNQTLMASAVWYIRGCEHIWGGGGGVHY